MKLILRILAAPVSGVLFLAIAFFTFVLSVSGVILGFLSVIGFIIALLTIFTMDFWTGVAWMAASFLISPCGLPRLAEWLLDRLNDANSVLKDFIIG